MSRYSRQKYRDVDLSEVDANSHPITQLKFDGIWCGVEVSESGQLRYISRNGQLKHHEITNKQIEPGLYIGEYMYGSEWSKKEDRSGKLYLFDIVEHLSQDLTNLPYQARHEKLRQLKLQGTLPDHWQLVANYPTIQIDSIWSNLVESNQFEGVVFRSPDETWHTELLRAKLNITVDLRIVDFEPGKDGTRLSSTLGALVAVGSNGVLHSVGGGLSDKLRKDIWANREAYRGRTFICECKKIFDSGKLRHPQFLEWHSDK